MRRGILLDMLQAKLDNHCAVSVCLHLGIEVEKELNEMFTNRMSFILYIYACIISALLFSTLLKSNEIRKKKINFLITAGDFTLRLTAADRPSNQTSDKSSL